MGDQRSYLLVFSAGGASFEVFLPASWPDGIHGYMMPSIRNQVSSERSELPWAEAEKLAAQLLPLVSAPDIAEGEQAAAREFVEAIRHGKRVGST